MEMFLNHAHTKNIATRPHLKCCLQQSISLQWESALKSKRLNIQNSGISYE